MIILFKVLGVFILSYLITFMFTVTVTHIIEWVKQLLNERDLKEENLKKRPQNIVQPKNKKKLVYNDVLGVWEIDE